MSSVAISVVNETASRSNDQSHLPTDLFRIPNAFTIKSKLFKKTFFVNMNSDRYPSIIHRIVQSRKRTVSRREESNQSQ